MKYFVDLHLHGPFSRGTSKNLTLGELEKYARIKGLNLLGTGDFTHPKWIAQIDKELKKDSNGIFRSKTGFPFVLQTELSLIYSFAGRGRRIHVIILVPDRKAVSKITEYLLTKGRIDYDGRPIFGIPASVFAKKMNEIDSRIEVIPAHAWTPWFSVFGSKSGFDSLEEAFGDSTHLIHAIETGMSSDPPMNWRIPFLDDITLLSNSDAHSFWPWRLGRECNIMDFKELNYDALLDAIRIRKGMVATVEVDPGYGKYHFDGHAPHCSFSPAKTKENKGKCSECKKKVTVGVLSRVEELAKRPLGFKHKNSLPFHSVMPLSDIISLSIGSPVASKKVWDIYNKLVSRNTELDVLLNITEKELVPFCDLKTASLILKNREGKIEVIPGYDGVYGKPVL